MKLFGIRFVLFTASAFLLITCKKKTDPVEPPNMSGVTVSSISMNSAIASLEVTREGNQGKPGIGICWSEKNGPTSSDGHFLAGSSIGTFTAALTSLNPNTTYYVRGYAVTEKGTFYGPETSFKTPDGWTYVASYTQSQFFNLDGKKIYAVGYPGVLLSSPDGLFWKQIASTYYVSCYGWDIFNQVNSDYFYSSDNGDTWTKLQLPSNNKNVELVGQTKNAIYIYNGTDLLKTTDKGATWTKVTGPFSNVNTSIRGTCVNNVLFIAQGNKYYRSEDDGGIFTEVTGIPWTSAYDAGTMYSAEWNGLYSSSDNGTSFSKVSEKTLSSIIVYNGKLFAVSTGNEVLVSNDKGQTWSNFEEQILQLGGAKYISLSNGTLYCLNANRIYKRKV